jgi:hypothetical protein
LTFDFSGRRQTNGMSFVSFPKQSIEHKNEFISVKKSSVKEQGTGTK